MFLLPNTEKELINHICQNICKVVYLEMLSNLSHVFDIFWKRNVWAKAR